MQTALYRKHLQAGAQMVDFCGWQMPLHYGSQLQEHHHVRVSSGMFDVSHMCRVDVVGSDAYYFLYYVLANDVSKLSQKGSAFYTCLLNEEGGIIDDLIVYRLDDEVYRLVVNAGSRDKVLLWLNVQADRYDVIIEERKDLAMLAVQGPEAIQRVITVMKEADFAERLQATRPFQFIEQEDWMFART